MISIINYLLEAIVLPDKIKEGMVSTKITPYDSKAAQVKANQSQSVGERRQALLRRTTMI